MLNSKRLGGTLLIVGTSIGGGMLALPIATAQAGLLYSTLFLTLCWLVMTTGALLVLEVNLRLPPGSNLISMAKTTLGVPGQIITWITCLCLFYALLASYISGSSDVFGSLLHQINIMLSDKTSAILFTGVFGFVVYHGIKAVDYMNRVLMLGKLGIYLLLVFIIAPHVNTDYWQTGSISSVMGGIMILVSSFGFASIVPSMREYFKDDIPALRQIIIFGSFIPLLCYIVWDAVIMGVIHANGANGLTELFSSNHATSGLTAALHHALHNPWITGFFSFFTSICMLTAFLAVSLGLFDFLADGLKLQKKGLQGWGVFACTFLPPLVLVLFQPGLYLRALSYAGVCCIILLLLLPISMAWKSRNAASGEYYYTMVPGGKPSLLLAGFSGLFLLMLAAFY